MRRVGRIQEDDSAVTFLTAYAISVATIENKPQILVI
jgi:hypothetical protein